ncbi:MAG: peptidoglycan DD-metalloendopeptidase family protein [Ghiorsea sp.]
MTLCVITLVLLATVEGIASKANPPISHDEWLLPYLENELGNERVEVVQSGDTAGAVLTRLGFPMVEVANMINAAKPVYPLKSVYIGHQFIRIDKEDSIEVTYQVNAEQQLSLKNIAEKEWQVQLESRDLVTRTVVVEGIINDSLFYDAAKAGLGDSLTIKLVDMFAWDIDFVRDLRKGDSFKVMYEESYDDAGKRVGYTILAAEFINKGHTYTGIRFENKQGDIEYYNDEGKNLRKTYLKSPVKYSRISSRFTTSRKHPVLGYTRAHRGVDYAAKSGTPIRAVGDGKIVYKGWKSGYGRFIEIRHNNGIHSTAYAHMRKYGKGMRKGKRVHQGQIIGYVGMSGLATGPHLHFEFRSRGRAVNPLKIKHKSANPVAKTEMTAFRLKAKSLLRLMAIQSQANAWG